MDQNKHDIEELLAKWMVEETTREEERALEEWSQQSTENEKELANIQKTRTLIKSHYAAKQELDIDVEQEWARFNEATNRKKGKVVKLDQEPSKSRWLKVAAALVLLAVSGLVIYNFMFNEIRTAHHTAETKIEIILPDSSVVTLNAHSSLTYPEQFSSKERRLTLKGEAFFDVQQDKARPFIIDANKVEVKVLGTSFNVNTTTDKTEVVVATGLVQLKASNSDGTIQLEQGEVGTIDSKGDLTKSLNQDVNFDSWKTGAIVFKNADLVAVVNTLNKIYNVSISISEEVSTECKVTVSFDRQSLESVLSVIKATLDLTIEKQGEQLIITKAGC